MKKSDDDDETIEEEIPNETTVAIENDPDYSEEHSTSSDDEDLVGEDDYEKNPHAKSLPKIVLNTDVTIPPTETDSPPSLETITIPEIVEAMIKS
jgi:hypothetical protein